MTGSITIDCNDCTMQCSDACEDCLVTYVCSRDPGDAVVVDEAELVAMRTMAEVGLVPRLRHQRRTG